MKNLLKKLSEIRKQTGFIKKAKVGENLTYKAVSADMVLFEVRNLVDNQNLFLSTQVLKEELEIKERTEMRWNKYEKKEEQKHLVNYITKLDILYTWYDVESGESLNVQWKCTAHNTDPAKSNGSALTYAEKYFFLKYFNIISSENEKLDPDCQKAEEIETKKQQDINKKTIPETKEKKVVNWITADGKKTLSEEKLQNLVATSFNNVLTQALKVDEKKAQLTELKEKYINGFQGLSLSTEWFNRLYQESLTESHSF